MILYRPGDVVLILFPFTDLGGFKKRPALILSVESYQRKHQDVIILALTSQSQLKQEDQLTDWQKAGLPRPTWFKPVIATISLDLINRRLGCLVSSDWKKVERVLSGVIDHKFLGK